MLTLESKNRWGISISTSVERTQCHVSSDRDGRTFLVVDYLVKDNTNSLRLFCEKLYFDGEEDDHFNRSALWWQLRAGTPVPQNAYDAADRFAEVRPRKNVVLHVFGRATGIFDA